MGSLAAHSVNVMTASIEYRLAKSADAMRIAAMSRDLIEAGLQWRWRSERILRQIRDLEVNVLVGQVANRTTLAGFGIMHYGVDDAHLLLLAVHPNYRRQNIGRSLVEWLECSARVAGIARVKLEVRACNHASRHFYQALGYRESQILQRYYYGIEAAVRMQHDLRVSV